MVIQANPAQPAVTEFKPERFDQVQAGTGISTKANRRTGIERDFRLIQNYIEHRGLALPNLSGTTETIGNNEKNREICDNPLMTHDPLHCNFLGLEFNTPLVLLSGCVGFGEEYTRVKGFDHRDVGAVCLKGTTLEPRLGNTPHRICETPAGMLNAIGLQNPGAEYVVNRILPQLDFTETRFIANVSGSTVEEYAQVTRLFDQSPVDAIEINISCPNVKRGGVAFGNDPEMSARVVEVCRQATTKPLITKLSPNQTDISANARRCIDAGTDAFATINTLMGMRIDIDNRKPIIGNNQGGLSGPAIKPVALLRTHQVYQVCKPHAIPIIGQGGITTANDALEFLIAGASVVGIGTALFYDPLVCKTINTGIREYLETHHLSRIDELVGTLELN